MPRKRAENVQEAIDQLNDVMENGLDASAVTGRPDDVNPQEVQTADEPKLGGNGKRKPPDRSNPPFYMLTGKHNVTGARQIIGREHTVGRMRKFMRMVDDLLTGNYSDVQVLKCKEVDISNR